MSHLSLRTKLAIMVALNMALVAIFLLLFFPGRMDGMARRWAERRADGVGHVLAGALGQQLGRGDTNAARELLASLQSGGNAMCATCHVYVDPAWLDRLPPMLEFEDVMLDSTASPRLANSRLSCQLIIDEDCEGLTVQVPPTQI